MNTDEGNNLSSKESLNKETLTKSEARIILQVKNNTNCVFIHRHVKYIKEALKLQAQEIFKEIIESNLYTDNKDLVLIEEKILNKNKKKWCGNG